MNSLIYRVHIFNWVRSCLTKEQLATCHDFVSKLYNLDKIIYEDFAYLMNLIKEMKSKKK